MEISYPGVFVEEIPGGVRPISGVPTSIVAFIGPSRWGATDEPVAIGCYRDFERTFGGAAADNWLWPAVLDFFQNGGRHAIVVRLYRPSAGKPATAELAAHGLALTAASPGAWGNRLRFRVEEATRQTAEGVGRAALFNLWVHDTGTGATEEFLELSVAPDSRRRVDEVVGSESGLVKVKELPSAVPTPHGPPAPGAAIWQDDDASSKVEDANQAGDGEPLQLDDFTGAGKEAAKTGLYALQKADLFNILCIPPYRNGDVDPELVDQAARYCERRRAMLLVDPPSSWKTHHDAKANVGEVGTASSNAALFFPRLRRPNPFRDDLADDYVPCGAVAGVIARTDAQRGVWKAAAGLEATLVGVPELSVRLTNTENGELNPLAINCLRARAGTGAMVWGARTLQGKDMLASEWKYIPVRRTALFLEESLERGTRWVVFEPNDEQLWARIRMSVGVFLHQLFRAGAFQGSVSRDAYFVKCDRETTTQADIDQGVVNIVVGFAPLRPAEFVVLKIGQLAGRDATGGGSDTAAATRRRGAL